MLLCVGREREPLLPASVSTSEMERDRWARVSDEDCDRELRLIMLPASERDRDRWMVPLNGRTDRGMTTFLAWLPDSTSTRVSSVDSKAGVFFDRFVREAGWFLLNGFVMRLSPVEPKPFTFQRRRRGRMVTRLEAMMATPGSTRVHTMASVPASVW